MGLSSFIRNFKEPAVAKFTTKVFSKIKNVPQPESAALMSVPVDIDFPAANYAVGDIIEVIEVPPGVVPQDWSLHLPDIDTNATPTIAWSFGELNAGSTDLAVVYAAGLTAGQTNAVVRNPSTDAAQAVATGARRLGLKVTAAAATYAGAGKTGQMLFDLRG